MSKYEWEHSCRACSGVGPECEECSGTGVSGVEEIENPHRQTAKCPYCQDGEVGILKDDYDCGHVDYGTMYRECSHLVYFQRHTERYEPFARPISLPNESESWSHSPLDSDDDEFLINDMLFDLSMRGGTNAQIASIHEARLFETVALGKGMSKDGKGYYIALRGQGGTVFARDVQEFLALCRTVARPIPRRD